MANKRIDQLPLTAAFDVTDLIEKERDPSGSRVHENATLQQLVDWLLGQLNYNVFQNTLALRANTIYIDSKVYAILGDVTRGDGSARLYFYDSTSLNVDDGASVLKPDAINVVDPGRYLQFTT